MTTSDTDRIVKEVHLRAAPERVWRAIGDAKEFGSWFGMALDGPFEAGARLTGTVVPTTVDPAVARAQEPYAGMQFEVLVDRVEPPRLLSFRWHPGDVVVRGAHETMTQVDFEIAAAPGGTHLTITESGFDRVPLERRAKAFAMNEQGWSAQAVLIEKYLAHAA